MFLGHMALGLAAKPLAPRVSLAAWFVAVQLADLIWPVLLLLGVEHVRIVPGITAFTPLDFYHYPWTHSLVAGMVWAAVFGGLWYARHRRDPRNIPAAGQAASLLGVCVLSHWLLDVIVHRPDLPVLPGGPYVGLGVWNSVAATLVIELSLFAVGLVLYLRAVPSRTRRLSFWLLIGFLVVIYFGAAFGPPPPDVRTLAFTALALWLIVPWAWWADR
jgi:hypothetical protein